MNPLIHLKAIPLFLIVLLLACFALPQNVQAVSPAPDGAYFGANTAEGGSGTLFSLTTGSNNTAIGSEALFSLTTGFQNTALGAQALKNNTADQNTAIGFQALVKNTTGSENTATGWRALFQNTSGINNTANGSGALYSNTIGQHNTANGFQALFNNTTGIYNTAIGLSALYRNIAGSGNTAVGVVALSHNTTAFNNTAIGNGALYSNIDGAYNTANGYHALFANIHGSNNIAVGVATGYGVTTASNVICIGANVAGADVSNTTWIGGVYGVTTQSGTTAPVIVSADGQLGTVASSERFKKDIATMEKASEAVLSLRPVTFHYKTDTKGRPQFGLIAEEVAKVNPALVLPDKEGKPYTVRYDQVNAMLLNEFLKEHRAVQELKKEVAALTAGLQKISAQLEASKPAPQVVNNP